MTRGKRGAEIEKEKKNVNALYLCNALYVFKALFTYVNPTFITCCFYITHSPIRLLSAHHVSGLLLGVQRDVMVVRT